MARDEIRVRLPSNNPKLVLEVMNELARRVHEEQAKSAPKLDADDHVIIEHED